MRFLIGLAIVAFLAWSGWWFLASTGHKEGVEAWLDDRRTAGWIAEYGDLSVGGYPNRVDTQITDLQLADPNGGWAWDVPGFEILSLSYKPNHVIAVWPDAQTISTAWDTIEITSTKLRGSLRFAPNPALTLDSTRLEVADMVLNGLNWSAALSQANFATMRVSDEMAPDFAHAIGLDIQDLSLPPKTLAMIDPDGRLPPTMETTHIDVIASFDKEWDRFSVEQDPPVLTALRLRDVNATWGRLNLQATGRLFLDADGYPEGEVTLKAKNWKDMLALLRDAGVIRADIARTIERGLNLLAGFSGDRNNIEVPLEFSNRLTRLGPIPIGPAPKLR